MKKRHHKKLLHEGQYVAEVDIELIDADEGSSPYISLEDAHKLDDVGIYCVRGILKQLNGWLMYTCLLLLQFRESAIIVNCTDLYGAGLSVKTSNSLN